MPTKCQLISFDISAFNAIFAGKELLRYTVMKKIFMFFTFALGILSYTDAHIPSIAIFETEFIITDNNVIMRDDSLCFKTNKDALCLDTRSKPEALLYDKSSINQDYGKNVYLIGGMFMCPVCGCGNAISGDIWNGSVIYPCNYCGTPLLVIFHHGDIVDIIEMY